MLSQLLNGSRSSERLAHCSEKKPRQSSKDSADDSTDGVADDVAALQVDSTGDFRAKAWEGQYRSFLSRLTRRGRKKNKEAAAAATAATAAVGSTKPKGEDDRELTSSGEIPGPPVASSSKNNLKATLFSSFRGRRSTSVGSELDCSRHSASSSASSSYSSSFMQQHAVSAQSNSRPGPFDRPMKRSLSFDSKPSEFSAPKMQVSFSLLFLFLGRLTITPSPMSHCVVFFLLFLLLFLPTVEASLSHTL